MKISKEGYSRGEYEQASIEKKEAEERIKLNRQGISGQTFALVTESIRKEARQYIREDEQFIKDLDNVMDRLMENGNAEAEVLNRELNLLKMRLDVDLGRVVEDEKLLREFKDKLAGKASL